jgi:hypothetical protein
MTHTNQRIGAQFRYRHHQHAPSLERTLLRCRQPAGVGIPQLRTIPISFHSRSGSL